MPTFARFLGITLLAAVGAGCGLLPGMPGTLPPSAGALALAKYGTYPGTTPTAFFAHGAPFYALTASSGSVEMLTDDDTDVVQDHYRALAKRDGWSFYELKTTDPTKFCHLTRGKEYVQASIHPQDRKVATPAPTPTPGPNDLPAEQPAKAAKLRGPGSRIILFVQER